jgi:hypothetical protein
MLARLSSLFKAGLELSFARANYENSNVGLAGTADHVGHKVLVTGRI